jgi:hypothetical protein
MSCFNPWNQDPWYHMACSFMSKPSHREDMIVLLHLLRGEGELEWPAWCMGGRCKEGITIIVVIKPTHV